jgi:cathepsin D
LQQLSSSQCLGSIFTFTSTSNSISPAWIVGDTFLKNVYTVFRANPPSVGFAALASDAQQIVTQAGVPTATIGSVAATVTGSGSGSGRTPSNAASPSVIMPCLAVLLSLFVMGSTTLFHLL